MINQFSRTEILFGEEKMEILENSSIAVFGVGGVGSFAVEALARGGIGHITLIDNDDICLTNINRQLHAGMNTIGKEKTSIMEERILNINPDADVKTINKFILPENLSEIFDTRWSYIIDAIDTVTAKLCLIEMSAKFNVPIISCMGTGNKIKPELLQNDDIYKTSVCPLAKVMRKQLKKRGVLSLDVCYSKEEPLKPHKIEDEENSKNKKRVTPGSVSFVPPVAGMIMAGHAIKNIIKILH